jgi:hypothetical protein
MAIAIKSIPTLEGSAANDFYTKAIEKGEKNAATIDFSAQVKSMSNILSKAKAK